jgi:hypothetical protein
MPYYQDSEMETGRCRSWSDVSDLVNEEVGKGSESCHGCILVFIATAILIGSYSVISSVNQV